MAYRLEFEIHKLPKMTNAIGHGSWKASHGRTKRWQRYVGQELLGRLPRSPLKRATVTYTRHSSTAPDMDGLVSGFKAIQDALILFRVISSDRMDCLESMYRWEKAKRGNGYISVVLEEKQE